jgi:hypothetical protein
VGLPRSKLKEFLDLEQGNHSVFDYTRQFNTLAQYGTYHIDTDEKKANLYRVGLTIHLQERLMYLSSLSYNELASAAIDQERMMKVVAGADEKKRKRMMPGSVVVLAVLLPNTAWCIPHLGLSCVDHNSSRIGAIIHYSNCGNSSNNNHNSNSNNNNSSTVLLPHHHSRMQSGHHSRPPTVTFRASTAGSWDISPVSAYCQCRTIPLELRQPWPIIRRVHRGVLCQGLVVPTIPPWRRSPREKTY